MIMKIYISHVILKYHTEHLEIECSRTCIEKFLYGIVVRSNII